MKITIYTRQSSLKINKKDISKKSKLLLIKENIDTDELVIYFVNTEEIIDLHKKYFDDPTTTDCISFPIDSPGEEKFGPTILGEIFICVDTAIEYSKKNSIKVEDEIDLYLIHGILHLIGYDDIEKEDRQIMRKKESESIEYLKSHV